MWLKLSQEDGVQTILCRTIADDTEDGAGSEKQVQVLFVTKLRSVRCGM